MEGYGNETSFLVGANRLIDKVSECFLLPAGKAQATETLPSVADYHLWGVSQPGHLYAEVVRGHSKILFSSLLLGLQPT